MEITPFIKKNASMPVYIQLYHYFRSEIEKGNLNPGSKLPSIRQLSSQLNLSRNTVESSYQQLVAEGYAESNPRSGLIVLNIDAQDFMHSEDKQKRPTKMVEQKDSNLPYDFQYGDIDLSDFPAKQWRKCMMEALDEQSQKIFAYGDQLGNTGLRKEIARYLYNARGVDCSPGNIVLFPGTQAAITMLSQLLSLESKRVAFENPGYDGVRSVFENFHSEIIPISLNHDGIDLDELSKSKAHTCYVTPSHQFPLGVVMSIQKRVKLLKWANKNNSYIIEDDYDGEFRYIGQPIPSLKSLDSADRVVYLGTFSKAFLPAARVSYAVLPDALMDKYNLLFSTYNQGVSPIIQQALYLFIKEGHFARHIRKMRKLYQDKHKILLSSIEKYFDSSVEVIGQRAGLHIILNFHGINAKNLAEKAEERGVRIYLTEKFWLNKDFPQGLNHIMLGFGGLSGAHITEGIRILSHVWKNITEKNK